MVSLRLCVNCSPCEMMVICMLIVLLFLFSAVIKENTGIAYPIVFCVLLEPIKAKNPKITYADLYQVIWDA
jgi:hypothetical protein